MQFLSKVLEEVVAIDEQTGHQDLEFHRQTLEVAKKMASLSPEERQQLVQQAQEEQNALNEEDGFEAQLQAQLAQLPPEQRAQAEVQIRKAFEEFQRMNPDEQAAVLEQQLGAHKSITPPIKCATPDWHMLVNRLPGKTCWTCWKMPPTKGKPMKSLVPHGWR